MTPSSICPFLWHGFSIDCRGDVFSCCHMKPDKLGNIYETLLNELTNTKIIIEHRKASIEERLTCLHDCNLLRHEKQLMTTISPRSDYHKMTYLHLNFGERCNIACVMCKVHVRERLNREILDPEVLTENIDLGPFKEIVVQGGEPLYIPECVEYLRHLGEMRKKYVLLTNGLLIDENMAHRLARDAEKVCVSINAATKETHELVNRGSNFDRVKENLRKLRHAIESSGLDMVLYGRMTITTISLPEIPLFLKTFRTLGFDRVNFGYDRATVPAYIESNRGFTQRLRRDVQKALGEVDRSRVDTARLEQLGLTSRPESLGGG